MPKLTDLSISNTLLDSFFDLMTIGSEEEWCSRLFQLGQEMGFDNTLIAVLPKGRRRTENLFLRSNYAAAWRTNYDRNHLAYIDPTVAHCAKHTTSLIWSPELFQPGKQRELYEEASSYGLRSGVSLPIHGPKAEVGMLCFVSHQKPTAKLALEFRSILPVLSLLRDIAFESGIDYAVPPEPAVPVPSLTPKELECLKWTAAGKSTWEISRILECSESAVNFHIANLREKLDSPSRRDAVVKAIRLGIISLG